MENKIVKYVNVELLMENIAKIQDLRTLSTKTIGEAIDNTPAANVEEVRHAHWIKRDCGKFNPIYKCSECGRVLMGYSNPDKVPYCHCGAKMDKERRK